MASTRDLGCIFDGGPYDQVRFFTGPAWYGRPMMIVLPNPIIASPWPFVRYRFERLVLGAGQRLGVYRVQELGWR
jgi:hypothetical protein